MSSSPIRTTLAIGCARLVQRLVDQGAEVHSLLLSEVPPTYSKIYDASGEYRQYAGDVRMGEAAQADRTLGLTGRTTAFGSEWHHRLDALPAAELIGAIEKGVSTHDRHLYRHNKCWSSTWASTAKAPATSTGSMSRTGGERVSSTGWASTTTSGRQTA